MTKKTTGLIFLWLSLITYCIDLGSKYLIVRYFELYDSIQILPIFNFTYVRNYGAAFSFLADHAGWQKYFFIAIAVIISAMLIYWLSKNRRSQTLSNIAYALVIGGALANMSDRLYHGFVVDFLDFYWGKYHYPIFNFADVAICIGAGLLILEQVLSSKRKN